MNRAMNELHERLLPVLRRQRWSAVLRHGALGLLVGACAASLLAAVRLGGVSVPAVLPLGLPLAGLLLGSGLALCRPRDWRSAAAAVDAHCGLKDRTVTALAFLEIPDADALRALQIEDAIRHLGDVDARQVAPLEPPRTLLASGVAVVSLAALLLIPSGQASLKASPLPVREGIQREAEALEASLLEELRELAEQQEQDDETLESLARELQELLREMKQPGVDEADALARLSEMQSAIAEARAALDVEAVDAALRKLAEALAPAAGLQATAEALQQGEYTEAAARLEDLDPARLSEQETRAVSEKLDQVARQLEDGKQAELSEATRELAEGLEKRSESQCKSGASKLATLCRQQGLRKDIAGTLAVQMAMLAESKNHCLNGQNGGDSSRRSDSPKQTWGRGATHQPLGDQATKIDSTRQRETLTGTQGAGPSEREVSHSAEGRQEATRALRESYDEYRRQTEAVLQSENLPLGHRETIRRYFEAIRPDTSTEDAATPESAGAPDSAGAPPSDKRFGSAEDSAASEPATP